MGPRKKKLKVSKSDKSKYVKVSEDISVPASGDACGRGLERNAKDGTRHSPMKKPSTRTGTLTSTDEDSSTIPKGIAKSIASSQLPLPQPAIPAESPDSLGVGVSTGSTGVGVSPNTPDVSRSPGVVVSPKADGSFTVSYSYPTAHNISNPKKSIEELSQLFTFQEDEECKYQWHTSTPPGPSRPIKKLRAKSDTFSSANGTRSGEILHLVASLRARITKASNHMTKPHPQNENKCSGSGIPEAIASNPELSEEPGAYAVASSVYPLSLELGSELLSMANLEAESNYEADEIMETLMLQDNIEKWLVEDDECKSQKLVEEVEEEEEPSFWLEAAQQLSDDSANVEEKISLSNIKPSRPTEKFQNDPAITCPYTNCSLNCQRHDEGMAPRKKSVNLLPFKLKGDIPVLPSSFDSNKKAESSKARTAAESSHPTPEGFSRSKQATHEVRCGWTGNSEDVIQDRREPTSLSNDKSTKTFTKETFNHLHLDGNKTGPDLMTEIELEEDVECDSLFQALVSQSQ